MLAETLSDFLPNARSTTFRTEWSSGTKSTKFSAYVIGGRGIVNNLTTIGQSSGSIISETKREVYSFLPFGELSMTNRNKRFHMDEFHVELRTDLISESLAVI